MFVVLPRVSEVGWLDVADDDSATLTSMLIPCPDDTLDAYEVSMMVNNARNEGPELIAKTG